MREIVEQECADHGRPVPTLRIKQSKQSLSSSGSSSKQFQEIALSLGLVDYDYLPILLHELAHYLNLKDRGHTRHFYKLLRHLLIKYDCYTEAHKDREGRYRASANIKRPLEKNNIGPSIKAKP